MKISKIGLMTITLFIASQGFSQNNNVVSAALEFQKYEPAIMQQDFEKAKGFLLDAKKYIDPAMTHETTSIDAKAHYYNVLINYGLMELAGFDESNDLDIYKENADSIMTVIGKSIETASTKKRWKAELDDYFNRKVSQARMIGEMMFKQKNFEMAFMGFAGAYKIKEIAKIEEERDLMKTNAIIAARNYLDTLDKQGETAKAMEFVSGALEMFPGSEDLAIAGVNLALAENDFEKAESFFNHAAAADPKNKALFSTMGSIYLTAADRAFAAFSEMKITDEGYQEKSDEVEDLYAKAEKNLVKALDIDAKYAEAAYQLGVLYLGRAEKLKTTASQMDFNNPNYNKVLEESQDMYRKAIDPLEVYIEQDPENVGVLNVLFQVHRNAGNDEKAMEYRKRAQEAAQEVEEGDE